MSLEDLPTELWLFISEFLTIGELFHAFHGLNNRCDRLLISHFQRYTIDLQSILKSDLNYFYEHYPSSVVSLRIFNNDDTPQQIDALLPRNFNLDRFVCLRSLLLNHIESIQTLRNMITQLSHLQQLTRLSINNFNNDNISPLLLNSIWLLPKLSYFHLDVVKKYESYFPLSEATSLSLERVELPDLRCHQSTLLHLFERTPRLQCLTVHFIGSNDDQKLTYIFEHIKALQISYHGSWDNLTNFLQTMPNLNHLTLKATFRTKRNGHKWEQFITEHLPNLIQLRFVIEYLLYDNIPTEQQVIDLLDSFRSFFWLKKHGWCVRCDWQLRYHDRNLHLYTLPYVSNHFYDCVSDVNIQSRTTCTHEINHHLYDSVNWLDYNDFPGQNSNVLPIHFPSLHELSLTLPVDNTFRSIIPRLDRLVSLRLRLYNENIYIQLQTLFDAAPKLHTLIFIKWPLSTSIKLLEQLKSKSTRQLDLSGFSPTGFPQYFNKEQCDILSGTPLGLQCEILSIAVRNRVNIIGLVNNMRNLRALVVKCADDRWEGSTPPLPSNDECLEWLRVQLPPTCILLREPRFFGRIRIWII